MITLNTLHQPLQKKTAPTNTKKQTSANTPQSHRHALASFLDLLEKDGILTADQVHLLKWFRALRQSIHIKLGIGKPLTASFHYGCEKKSAPFIDVPAHLDYKRESLWRQLKLALEIHRFRSVTLLYLLEQLVVHETLPKPFPHFKAGIDQACLILENYYLKTHGFSHQKSFKR